MVISGLRSGDTERKGGQDNSENGLPACNSEEIINWQSGKVIRDAWMYDGYSWKKLSPMSMKRDRPACSLAYQDGSVS